MDNFDSATAQQNCGRSPEHEGQKDHSPKYPIILVFFLGRKAHYSSPSLSAIEAQEGMKQSHVQAHVDKAPVRKHVRLKVGEPLRESQRRTQPA